MFKNIYSQHVCKLPTEGGKRQIVIKTIWDETSFNVTLFQEEKAYTGIMSQEKIAELSSQLGITKEDYMNQCRSALSNNGGDEHFIYIVDGSIFQWKKIHLEMKITFGTIHLSTLPVIEAFHDIIDVSVNNNCILNKKLLYLEKERDILNIDNKELLKQIGDCINLKNDMESQLYSQFLSVLNAKKRKIVQLEKLLKSNGLEVTYKEGEDDDDELNDIEDEEEENRRLYECDTEVDTDDSDNVEDNETSKATKESPKNGNSFDSDFEHESSFTYNLPKLNKINKKSSDDNKKNEINKNETELSVNCVNVFKPKNCKKRLSNEREIDYCDEEPGPSGTKVSKLTDESRGKEKYLNTESAIESRNKSFECDNYYDRKKYSSMKKTDKNHSSVSSNENEKSPVKSCSGKSVLSSNDKMKEANKISENDQKNSSVDDLISNLLA